MVYFRDKIKKSFLEKFNIYPTFNFAEVYHMVQYHERSKRNYAGGKFKTAHKKRKARMGREPIETKIGNDRKKIVRTRGGNEKIKAYALNTISVTNSEDNSVKSAKITHLIQNHASVDYQRRNILTKGAIIDTDLGKVKITSRPGQCGQVSGIIMKD